MCLVCHVSRHVCRVVLAHPPTCSHARASFRQFLTQSLRPLPTSVSSPHVDDRVRVGCVAGADPQTSFGIARLAVVHMSKQQIPHALQRERIRMQLAEPV